MELASAVMVLDMRIDYVLRYEDLTICVGNDGSWPNAETNTCWTLPYPLGLVDLTSLEPVSAVKGQYFFIFKPGWTWNGNHLYVSELRLYQLPNLLQAASSSEFLQSYYASDTVGVNNVENLKQGLNNGPMQFHYAYKPAIDLTASPTVEYAENTNCWVVDSSKYSKDDPFVFGIEFDQTYFQNAVLLIQDLIEITSTNTPLGYKMINYYAHTWKVFVGDSPDYTQNKQCLGDTSFLRSDYKDYFDTALSNYFANFGFEAWCNLPGKYTHFVSESAPDVHISICALAVYGAKYARPTQVPTEILVDANQSGQQTSTDYPRVERSLATIGSFDPVSKVNEALTSREILPIFSVEDSDENMTLQVDITQLESSSAVESGTYRLVIDTLADTTVVLQETISVVFTQKCVLSLRFKNEDRQVAYEIGSGVIVEALDNPVATPQNLCDLVALPPEYLFRVVDYDSTSAEAQELAKDVIDVSQFGEVTIETRDNVLSNTVVSVSVQAFLVGPDGDQIVETSNLVVFTVHFHPCEVNLSFENEDRQVAYEVGSGVIVEALDNPVATPSNLCNLVTLPPEYFFRVIDYDSTSAEALELAEKVIDVNSNGDVTIVASDNVLSNAVVSVSVEAFIVDQDGWLLIETSNLLTFTVTFKPSRKDTITQAVTKILLSGTPEVWALPPLDPFLGQVSEVAIDSEGTVLAKFLTYDLEQSTVRYNGKPIEFPQTEKSFPLTITLKTLYATHYIKQTVLVYRVQEVEDDTDNDVDPPITPGDDDSSDTTPVDIETAKEDENTDESETTVDPPTDENEVDIVDEGEDEVTKILVIDDSKVTKVASEISEALAVANNDEEEAIGKVLGVENPKEVALSAEIVTDVKDDQDLEAIATFDIFKFMEERASKKQKKQKRQEAPPKLVFEKELEKSFALPKIKEMSMQGRVTIAFSSPIVKPVLSELTYLLQSVSKSEQSQPALRSLQTSSMAAQNSTRQDDRQTQNQLMTSLLKVSGSVKTELVPFSEHNADKKKYHWSVEEFNEKRLQIKFSFENPDYISISGTDKIKVTFSNTEVLFRPQKESLQSVPNEFEMVASLPPQDKVALNRETVESIQESGQSFLALNFLIGMFSDLSLNMFFGSIISLQLLGHLPLGNVSLPAQASQCFEIMVKIVSFDYFPMTEWFDFGFTPTEPWSENFDNLDYGSLNFMDNMGSVMIFLWIGVLYVIVTVVLSRCTRIDLSQRLRRVFQPSVVRSTTLISFEGYLFELIVSASIGMKMFWIWKFLNAMDYFSMANMVCAALTIVAFTLLLAYFAFFESKKIVEYHLDQKISANEEQLSQIREIFKTQKKKNAKTTHGRMKASMHVNQVILLRQKSQALHRKNAENVDLAKLGLYEPLYQGMRQNSRLALMTKAFILFRRMSMVFLAMYLQNHVWLYILTFVALTLVHICYLTSLRPFVEPSDNRLLASNGAILLVAGYFVMVINGIATTVQEIQNAGRVLAVSIYILWGANAIYFTFILLKHLKKVCIRKVAILRWKYKQRSKQKSDQDEDDSGEKVPSIKQQSSSSKPEPISEEDEPSIFDKSSSEHEIQPIPGLSVSEEEDEPQIANLIQPFPNISMSKEELPESVNEIRPFPDLSMTKEEDEAGPENVSAIQPFPNLSLSKVEEESENENEVQPFPDLSVEEEPEPVNKLMPFPDLSMSNESVEEAPKIDIGEFEKEADIEDDNGPTCPNQREAGSATAKQERLGDDYHLPGDDSKLDDNTKGPEKAEESKLRISSDDSGLFGMSKRSQAQEADAGFLPAIHNRQSDMSTFKMNEIIADDPEMDDQFIADNLGMLNRTAAAQPKPRAIQQSKTKVFSKPKKTIQFHLDWKAEVKLCWGSNRFNDGVESGGGSVGAVGGVGADGVNQNGNLRKTVRLQAAHQPKQVFNFKDTSQVPLKPLGNQKGRQAAYVFSEEDMKVDLNISDISSVIAGSKMSGYDKN